MSRFCQNCRRILHNGEERVCFLCNPLQDVIGAPQWLKDRMKKLRELPPPTIEEVREQWKASADLEYNHRYDDIWRIDSKGRKVVR
jgi:hypothetical protein